MSLSSFNTSLFLLLNAPDSPNLWTLKIASFISHDLIGVYIVLVTILLVKSSRAYKKAYFYSVLCSLVSLVIAALIDSFYYHPRPFVLGLGHLITSHSATNSFPSHHMLTISTIAFAFLLQGYQKIGFMGIGIAVLVGWSRIYLGVHFPLDIIGGAGIAFFIVLAFILFLRKYQKDKIVRYSVSN